MIKQLIKQIWVQRNINIWLWLELMVVLVCLFYVVDYLYITTTTYFSPLGYNYEHVYKVELGDVQPTSTAYITNETDSMLKENLFVALERMRAYPGVELACVNGRGLPFNARFSNGSRGIDTVWVHGIQFSVSPSFFRVFRVTDKQGQTEPLVEEAMQSGTVIISEDTERKFALEGATAMQSGLRYWGQETADVIIRGITQPIRHDEFSPQYPVYFDCSSEMETIKRNGIYSEFSIRILPQYDTPEFIHTLRSDMKTQLRIGNLYLVDVVSYEELRTNYYRSNGKINDVKTYVAGLLFLLINIFLGVIGTFWIRTQQRRSEIALRMALGSTRTNIRRYLLSEGFLLLLLAAIPSGIIWGNIVYMDLIQVVQFDFTVDRFLIGCLITFLVMAFMIAMGILIPARRAMSIQPAETLHED